MSSGPQLISEMPLALQEGSHSRRARAASRPRPPIRRLRHPRHQLCRCSMFSQLFTTGSTATACPGVSTAANESGAAQSVGLGSGIGGTGAGAPAISAGMGQATFVGVLSVPTAWAGGKPSGCDAVRRHGAIPAAQASARSGIPSMMPVATTRTRGLRFELHSTVIPFTPAAGWPASPGERPAGWLQTKRGLNSS
ncbi:MAG: PPE family protein, SVP subgroup [Mycobacterium sp.]